MATDLLTLVSQSKSKHVIQSKSTGQVLGYAFLLSDQSVSSDQLQLVPWRQDEVIPHVSGTVDTNARQLHEGRLSPPTGNEPRVQLVSDLDLSDSSTNETFENVLSPDVNLNDGGNLGHNVTASPSVSITSSVHEDFGNKTMLSLTPSPSSKIIKESPKLTFPPSFPTASHAPILNQSAPEEGSSIPKPTTLLYSPNLIPKPTATPQEDSDKLKSLAKSMTQDIVNTLNNRQGNSEGYVQKKRPSEDLSTEMRVVHKTKRLDTNYNFSPSPGINSRFSPFYELLPQEGGENRRVRCMLCGDGKILSLQNFHRHIKAIHEPPVKCEVCGRLFNGEQIKVHRRKTCGPNIKNNAEMNNYNQGGNTSVGLPQNSLSSETNFSSCVKKSQYVISPSPVRESINQPTLVKQPSLTGSDSEWAFLILSSVVENKARMKMKVKQEANVKKAMKAFGKQHKADYKKLKFLIGGVELTGEERVGDLEGNIIDVHGELFI